MQYNYQKIDIIIIFSILISYQILIDFDNYQKTTVCAFCKLS